MYQAVKIEGYDILKTNTPTSIGALNGMSGTNK